MFMVISWDIKPITTDSLIGFEMKMGHTLLGRHFKG